MKTNIIDELKARVDKISDERKRKLINSIFKKDNWYLKISLDTFVSILLDLNYSKEEALLIFEKLNTLE